MSKHRPDDVTVQDEGQRFTPHPEGQFAATCVDVIDMGEFVKEYPGTPAYIAKEVAIVFWTGEMNEEGHPHEISAKVTVSMGEKANLRKLLEAWRGKSYTDDEAKAGVPLHKLVGHAALVSVEHKRSKRDRTYAKLNTIAPLPKVMQPPDLPEYERPAFWAERKEENAKAVATFKKGQRADAGPGKAMDTEFNDFDATEEEADDLPF